MMGIAECPLCRHGNNPDKAGNIYDLGDKCPFCHGTKVVHMPVYVLLADGTEMAITNTEPTIGEILDGQEGE